MLRALRKPCLRVPPQPDLHVLLLVDIRIELEDDDKELSLRDAAPVLVLGDGSTLTCCSSWGSCIIGIEAVMPEKRSRGRDSRRRRVEW